MSILATRRVYLDHVRPGDFGWIYDLLASPDAGPLFRFGGRIPPPGEVQQHFWDDILAHWVVVGVRDHRRRGLVTLGSADLANGYAYLSAVAVPEARRSGLLMEGLLLAVDYAFRTWALRKLYAEVCEPALRQFRGVVGRFFVEEGRLREHQFRDGAFRDVVTLAMYRPHWQALMNDFGRLRPTSEIPLCIAAAPDRGEQRYDGDDLGDLTDNEARTRRLENSGGPPWSVEPCRQGT